MSWHVRPFLATSSWCVMDRASVSNKSLLLFPLPMIKTTCHTNFIALWMALKKKIHLNLKYHLSSLFNLSCGFSSITGVNPRLKVLIRCHPTVHFLALVWFHLGLGRLLQWHTSLWLEDGNIFPFSIIPVFLDFGPILRCSQECS